MNRRAGPHAIVRLGLPDPAPLCLGRVLTSAPDSPGCEVNVH